MILKYLRKKDFPLIAVIIALVCVQVYLDLEIPGYMTDITETITTGGSVDSVIADGSKMLACAFGSLIASVVCGFIAAYIAASLSATLRKKQFDNVEKFSLEEINRFSISSLVTRSTNDVTQVQMAVAMGLQVIIKAPILAAWAIGKIAGKNMEWTVITAVAVLAVVLCIGCVMIYVTPKFRKIQWLNDDLNRVIKENLTGLRVIRAYNAEKYQEKKFDDANTRITDTHVSITRSLAFMSPVMSTVMSFLSLAIYWVGAYIIDRTDGMGRLTEFSNMIVFSSYAVQVIMAFIMLIMIFMILPRATVAAKRIEEVINTEPTVTDGNLTNTSDAKGEISFENVSFKYPDSGDYVLRDISFTAKTGETVAFIGSTGSGKTTLVNLIPRFYDVSEGTVKVDGMDVKDYTLTDLRRKIGYVPQRAVMFNQTIEENVKYGDTHDERTEEDVKKAVAVAQGKEFVEKESEGYQRMISEGGTNLSGGQKQRIAIARAVCRKPEIYIFDDSFSALDYRTDRKLRDALRNETASATKLIVAQRIGTIMDADRIIVLDNGKIAGIGTHDELMKSCDVYRDIAYSQLSEEELR